MNVCECYDFAKGKWEQMAPMLNKRKAFALVSLPDGIYAIGGIGDKGSLNDVERYDYYNNRWEKLRSMTDRRSYHTAVASADYQSIHVFGGIASKPLKSIEAYSVIDDRWDSAGAMCTERSEHATCLVRQRI